jgi:hypothetical protein
MLITEAPHFRVWVMLITEAPHFRVWVMLITEAPHFRVWVILITEAPHFRVWVILITEVPAVNMNWKPAVTAMFRYLNLCLSVKLNHLWCSSFCRHAKIYFRMFLHRASQLHTRNDVQTTSWRTWRYRIICEYFFIKMIRNIDFQ